MNRKDEVPLSYGEDILWPAYYQLNNYSAEGILSVVEEAAALKEILQQKGYAKAEIIKTTFPGIWALGHLLVENLSTWDDAIARERVGRLIADTDKLLQEDLESEVGARLLLMKSILHKALKEKNKSDECCKAYRILCQQHKGLADELAKIISVEENKLQKPTANKHNMADLYTDISELPGIGQQIFEKRIKGLAKSNSYDDALEAAYRRLMGSIEQGTEIS